MGEIKISDEDHRQYGAKLHDQQHGWNCDCAPSFRHKFDDYAYDVLTALAAAGRLLPPGGEEQYRIVWSGQEGTYVDGEIDDLQDGLDHLAIIRRLSFVKEAHLERRILTDWSPVVSDNTEGESSG